MYFITCTWLISAWDDDGGSDSCYDEQLTVGHQWRIFNTRSINIKDLHPHRVQEHWMDPGLLYHYMYTQISTGGMVAFSLYLHVHCICIEAADQYTFIHGDVYWY